MKKVNFLGATHGEGVVGKGCVKFVCQISTLAMWLVNMNLVELSRYSG